MDNSEFEDIQPEQEKAAIYSKWAILLFSVFFSPFVGSILLMLNLRRIGLKAQGFMIVISAFAYALAAELIVVKFAGLDILHLTPEKLLASKSVLYYSKALDILGGAILAEYFFKRYFKSDTYVTRSAFPAFLIVMAISFLLGFVF